MEGSPDSLKDCRRSSGIGLKRCSGSRLEELFKSPSLDFMVRKRKRHKTDEDSLSLSSFDSISVDLSIKDEPKNKRRRSLIKIQSLVSLLSPVKPVKKVSSALQRSLSWKNLASPVAKNQSTPYKKPVPTPPRRRKSTLWYETVNGDDIRRLNKMQIERQEVIHELYTNEEDLIEDLNMVKHTYHDSLKKLGLLSELELQQIFGHIDSLVPLHEELVDMMRSMRLPTGHTEHIGQVLLDWVPKLEMYVPYCSNQVYAKALLDFKKQDPSVEDFLERCQESPFSRKLDLWSFLDVPRSRLVKYPLLFKNIIKHTCTSHRDIPLIEEAIRKVEEIIKAVDEKTGEAKCKFTQEKLEYIDERQENRLVDESKVILCDGVLKNNRGTKLQVFLFEKILVLTRPATRGNTLRYQVYRTPIPTSELVLEDLQGDGSGKHGSFKSAFSQDKNGKHSFKVSFMDSLKGQSHTLHATDEHAKRQWMQSLQSVLTKPSTEDNTNSTTDSTADNTTNDLNTAENLPPRSSGDGQESPSSS